MTDSTQQNSTEIAERRPSTWVLLCHLSPLVLFLGIPFGHLLGPLVIWLIFKDRDHVVDREGRKVLNFQITVTIYLALSALLMLILIGFLLFGAVLIADIVLSIRAAIKISNMEDYEYPFSYRFLKTL